MYTYKNLEKIQKKPGRNFLKKFGNFPPKFKVGNIAPEGVVLAIWGSSQ